LKNGSTFCFDCGFTSVPVMKPSIVDLILLEDNLSKYEWSLEKTNGKYTFIIWDDFEEPLEEEVLEIVTAKTPSALWKKIEKLLREL